MMITYYSTINCDKFSKDYFGMLFKKKSYDNLVFLYKNDEGMLFKCILEFL